jgi:hypothetical protein
VDGWKSNHWRSRQGEGKDCGPGGWPGYIESAKRIKKYGEGWLHPKQQLITTFVINGDAWWLVNRIKGEFSVIFYLNSDIAAYGQFEDNQDAFGRRSLENQKNVAS